MRPRHRRRASVRSRLCDLGALCWLPDVRRWAEVVAHFLKPGGRLYLPTVTPRVRPRRRCKERRRMPGCSYPISRRAYAFRRSARLCGRRSAVEEFATLQWAHLWGDSHERDRGCLNLDGCTSTTKYPGACSPSCAGTRGCVSVAGAAWLPLAFSLMATRTIARGV